MPERILVADDEPANRDLLEAVLTVAGYTVTLADVGAAALALRHLGGGGDSETEKCLTAHVLLAAGANHRDRRTIP